MSGSLPAASVDEFCHRVHPRLVRSLALFCGDVSIAEELAQEALVRAWDRWPSVSAMRNPQGWVYRVGFNLAMSRGRRRAIERRALEASAAHPTPAVPDIDDAIAVREAIAALPPRQRAAIVLRYFADLPVDATAEVMRCRAGTVKALTSQAMARLDSLLRDGVREEVAADG